MTSWADALCDFEQRLSRQGSRRRQLSPRTRTAYLKDARILSRWLEEHGVCDPETVTPSALEAALRDLGWAASTRARALTAARLWLEPYFPPGRSPAARIPRPRAVAPVVTRINRDEAREVVDSTARRVSLPPGDDLDPLALRNHAIVEVLYGSGLRRQEVCDLVIADIDFEHETLSVLGKGGKSRTVPLTEPSVQAIGRWLRIGRPLLVAESDGPATSHLFVSRAGRPLDGSTIYRVVSAELRRIGRPGGPHVLRHAAATHLLEGHDGAPGAHLRVVQEVLGHQSLATTQRYTGVTTRDIQNQLRKGHPRG